MTSESAASETAVSEDAMRCMLSEAADGSVTVSGSEASVLLALSRLMSLDGSLLPVTPRVLHSELLKPAPSWISLPFLK